MSPDFVKEIMSILPKDGYSSDKTIELEKIEKLAETAAHVTTLDDLEKAESAERELLVPENDGISQGGE